MVNPAELYAVNPKSMEQRDSLPMSQMKYGKTLQTHGWQKKRKNFWWERHECAGLFCHPISMQKKKYPTLVYAQGGPQSPLSQFFPIAEFCLDGIAGYVVVAPCRRGMPGADKPGTMRSPEMGRCYERLFIGNRRNG